MSVKDAIKNVRLGKWLETGEVDPAEIAAASVAAVKEAVTPKREGTDPDIVLIQDAGQVRAQIGETVKGGLITGAGIAVCAAGLGRMLLAPSGIIGMGLAVGGGAVTVLFGGKTLKDYWQVNRKLKK